MATDTLSARNGKEVNLIEEVRKQFSQEAWRIRGRRLESTLKTIQASPQAHSALKDLVRAGCNPAIVLREIGFFCQTDDAIEKKAKHARDELRNIVARLPKDASIVWRITFDFMLDFMRFDYGPYNEAFGCPRALEDVAKSLAIALGALKKHTHGKTIRNKHLVYLSYHIEAATKHRHYKEIAQLIACMPGQHQSNVVLLADNLGKTIRRHEQLDPDFFREARARVEDDLSSWQYFFNPSGH